MDGSQLLLLALLALAFVGCLALAVFLLWQGFLFALLVFAYAAASGFIGVALYIILWVVAFPVMLTICLIGGVIYWFVRREDRKEDASLYGAS